MVMFNFSDIDAIAQALGGRGGADADVLFGSYARQEATEDSDVDLRVGMPQDSSEMDRLYVEMRKTLAARWPMPLDLVIRSRDQVRQWQSAPYSLIHEAMKDGKVLYGRRPG